MLLSLSPNGNLKNDMATIIVVVFPLWPIFCRVIISKSIIILLLTQLLVKLA